MLLRQRVLLVRNSINLKISHKIFAHVHITMGRKKQIRKLTKQVKCERNCRKKAEKKAKRWKKKAKKLQKANSDEDAGSGITEPSGSADPVARGISSTN